MTKNRQTDRDSSRHASDESDEDSDGKSPQRGRMGQSSARDIENEVDKQIKGMIDEDSKKSGQ